MKRGLSILLFVLAFGVIYTSIFATQQKLTGIKNDEWLKERMTYLPESNTLQPYLLGFSTTYANYLWIRTILYFGEHYDTDKDYTWLVTMVDMVTRLNPYFYPAYEFAGVMLPSFSNDPDAARIILNRGISYLGDTKYSLPFYLGWLYYDKYDDYEQAAQYLTLAAHNKSAPPFYTALAASFYANAGKKDYALQFLYTAYYSSENPAVKKTVKDKIAALGGEMPEE